MHEETHRKPRACWLFESRGKATEGGEGLYTFWLPLFPLSSHSTQQAHQINAGECVRIDSVRADASLLYNLGPFVKTGGEVNSLFRRRREHRIGTRAT